ncbi:hypothetical protein QAD02_022968 [Eretmocerus hayati]|uniref:Uncharacterized protein n=1 Tax=Eretmocerus hayati TaxID=131215 RepID=A0ACC2PUA3_9HYME|nr:hypothetical protein QAD02_022968 [Eretmocerus hayati]
MQFPSLTLILSGIFIAYISYSIYEVSHLFKVPACTNKKRCFESYLKSKPSLRLNFFISTMRRPLDSEAYNIYSKDNFDFMKEVDIPLTINIPQRTRNNGTLFLHVVLSPQSKTPGKMFNSLLDDSHTVHTTMSLTKYAIPGAKAFSLLNDDDKGDNGEEKDDSRRKNTQPKTHLKSKVAFTIMTDDIAFPYTNVPVELSNKLRVTRENKFMPIIHYNFLYTRYRDLKELLLKMDSANVTIAYAPISLGKLRLILHIEAAMQNFKQLGFTEKDIDEVKSIFADTNLYLLGATVFISAMHILFDFLAFKNDISFWRSKSNLAGLSTQTVLWRTFSQSVIFLFLLDEGSSMLVLVPAGVGTIIEFWKTKKIMKAELVWRGTIFPRIRFNWNKLSAAESKTKEIDAESMRYMSYLLYPLVVLGAIYSLVYFPHKSWYSWCIHSLVNGVYAFGFLFMLPQLFVNYKLKSVAHLPWRSFMYKAFNTFIDDVFAFIITMPVAHRVACFRDDIVFLIYLYQRWLYPVDKTRVDSSTIDENPSIIDTSSKKDE